MTHFKTLWMGLWCALGLSLAIPPGFASPVFPAAGFALAWLIKSRVVWPSCRP